MNILTVCLNTTEDSDRLTRLGQALGNLSRLSAFMQCIEERRDTWTVLNFMLDDMLAYRYWDRAQGDIGDWTLVLGYCPDLEDLPEYTISAWGQVQAWVVYRDEWAITVQPADLRGGPDQCDLLVWHVDDFTEHCRAVPIVACTFGDDIGMRLNKAMREYRALEAMFEQGKASDG